LSEEKKTHNHHQKINQLADHLFRHESGKMIAVLTRVFGLHNLELAEDVMQEAFAKALKDWIYKIPDNPSGWLMQTAKNKAIDIIRRERHHKEFAQETSALLKSEYTAAPVIEQLFMEHEIQDSQLRMIFACCNPELSEADQIALTLKTCSGFSTQEIATALLSNSETIKKRLQRAKKIITEKNIQFNIPVAQELKRRLDIVLHTLYLIFNEGYNSSSKDSLIRKDLCEEALRLSLLLTEHPFTNKPECHSLVALMALLAARFEARVDEQGEIILLEDQDRSKWNSELIGIGLEYLSNASESDELSEYHIEAAIVAEHSMAPSFKETNWKNILQLYNVLMQINNSPVVQLNRAIVIGKLEGVEKAIREINAIPDLEKILGQHYLFNAVLGDLYKQKGDTKKASEYFRKAIELTGSSAEKKLMEKKING
jgi:RNA polymerase sigma factor (sigma-70 family)